MSIRLMAIVWDSDLPHDEKFVALALADWASDDGRSLYPSERRIAWKCGKSERAVRDTLGKLQERGVLERLSKGAPGRASEYKFNARSLPRRAPFQTPEETSGDARPEETSPITGNNFRPTPEETSADPSSDPSSIPHDTGRARASRKEPSALTDQQAATLQAARDLMAEAFHGRRGNASQKARTERLVRLGATIAMFEDAIEITTQAERDNEMSYALGCVARAVEDANGRTDSRGAAHRGAVPGRGSGARARGASGSDRRDGVGRGSAPRAPRRAPDKPAIAVAIPDDAAPAGRPNADGASAAAGSEGRTTSAA